MLILPNARTSETLSRRALKFICNVNKRVARCSIVTWLNDGAIGNSTRGTIGQPRFLVLSKVRKTWLAAAESIAVEVWPKSPRERTRRRVMAKLPAVIARQTNRHDFASLAIVRGVRQRIESRIAAPGNDRVGWVGQFLAGSSWNAGGAMIRFSKTAVQLATSLRRGLYSRPPMSERRGFSLLEWSSPWPWPVFIGRGLDSVSDFDQTTSDRVATSRTESIIAIVAPTH